MIVRSFTMFCWMSSLVFFHFEAFSFPVQSSTHAPLKRAEQFFERGDYKRALHHYSQAARYFERQRSWNGYVTALSGKAHALLKLGEYDQAGHVLDSAMTQGRKKLGNAVEVANVYYVYGVLFDLTNKIDASLNMHRKALAIRDSLLGANHIQVSESYNGIGEVYRYTLRDYVEAEKYFKRAIDIVETTEAYAKHRYRVYYNLATTNRLKNDFERALGYAFSAIQTLESLTPVDTASLIRCFGIVANIYNNQNNSDKAIIYYRKSISLRRNRKEMSSEMANDYSNLAQVYIQTGQHSRALHCVDTALTMLKHKVFFDSATLADVYLIKGMALREADRNPEAIQNYRQSLSIQRAYSRSNAVDLSNLYKHLSEVMNKIQQYDSALFYAQQSIRSVIGSGIKLTATSNPSFDILETKPRLYEILAHKGAVMMKLAEGNNAIESLEIAADCFSLSDRLMDIYWSAQENENSRLHFVSDNYYIYETALRNLYNLYRLTSDIKYLAAAFELMDKSKARILRQGVEQARQRARRNIPDSLLSQELNIKAKIVSLENRLSSSNELETERALNIELLSTQRELVRWQDKITKLFPQYVFEIKNLPVLNLSQLQKKMNKRVVFLEYFFGKETTYAIASFEGKQQFIQIDNGGLKNDIQKFCSLLTTGLQSRDLKADFQSYTSLSVSLYEKLLQPIVQVFGIQQDDKNIQLLIVPDGPLCLLPFQALLTSAPAYDKVDYRKLSYVVRRFEISYSFDAASHFATNHAANPTKQLLAFGWSDGDHGKYTAEDLPGTYRELQAIAGILPGDFRMGKQAAKHQFINDAADYNILHLAIHGVGGDQDLHNNYLQFRDDRLFAHELYGYNLKANLTVLSACETGYGKMFTAEGVYSIARGFFYAGSKRLLMTLWRINDGENVSLIQEFYRNVKSRENTSSALCKSQLAYLNNADEYTAHPRFWAGLVLWGNYTAIKSNDTAHLFYAGITVILIGSAAALIYMRKRKHGREILPSHTS